MLLIWTQGFPTCNYLTWSYTGTWFHLKFSHLRLSWKVMISPVLLTPLWECEIGTQTQRDNVMWWFRDRCAQTEEGVSRDWCHLATNQKVEKERRVILHSSEGKMVFIPFCSQTSHLENCERIHVLCFKPPSLGTLLNQSWESNTIFQSVWIFPGLFSTTVNVTSNRSKSKSSERVQFLKIVIFRIRWTNVETGNKIAMGHQCMIKSRFAVGALLLS